MAKIDFYNLLNERQYEAVTSSEQHLRIVAGAGSGKTRVLTYRIAYLIDELKIKPWNILAITFTNKVAAEMKKRITDMIPEVSNSLTIKTFHSFAAYFLRKEIKVLNFPTNFTILDEEDQTKLIKDIAASKGYRKSDKIVGTTINYIANKKLKGHYPEDIYIKTPAFEDERECLEMYELYEEEKNRMFCLDFDDLLLKTNYIFRNYPEIKIRWQNSYGFILIDEFQDTNDIEFELIKHIKKPSTSLTVVGDPDQTIYTWRGANQDIILKLDKTYPDMQTIILDRNYRSTTNILTAANKLISYNKMRLPKDLYSKITGGDEVTRKQQLSNKSEADYVSREVLKLKQHYGYKYSDIAILYRSSYVTADFEQAFVAKGIPYKVFGGTKFYQRREIKDVLAYFRLVTNTADDISFDRVINVPRRGIGEQTHLTLKKEASEHNQSLYEYIFNAETSSVSSRCFNALKTMILHIDKARDGINKNEEVFSKILEEMITSIGYYDYLIKEEDGEERIENVKALFEDLRHYLKEHPESTFDEYLQNIALVSAQDEIIDGDFVSFMTVHTAKGLEFPCVFVVRFNENVFPHSRALSENGYKAIEEERRLAYVAVTRAMRKLYLTCSSDYSYVVGSSLKPSQFYKQCGFNEFSEIRNEFGYNRRDGYESQYSSRNDFTSQINKPKSSYDSKKGFDISDNNISKWEVGDGVMHRTLGKGVVVALEGDDIIKVDFENFGVKSILSSHPYVSKVEVAKA